MLNNLTNPKEWDEAVKASRAFKAQMGGYLQLSKFEFEDYILEFEEEIKRALRRVDFRKAGNWESAVVELFYAQLLENHHEYLMTVFDRHYS